ncbi:PAS/PAC domain-containing protein [Paramagnetospirillum caucaseum]|uniref:PAS/PAC domain-containing protein n=1 Tax=Paramagnetospirillum caucaseum TaxID=1244869 RepID=M3AG73_9PROT|nr:diguanylate cyclase [Paramagnetospirillum caucaseum]EME71868.1 PAS/PAC domain-containing protein [Paramagnetospirillum caucaseum]
MPDLGERITRELTTRYVAVLVVLGALALMSFMALARMIGDAEGSAELVNMAGRQRMLVQRVAFAANRLVIAEETERPAVRRLLAEGLDQLEDRHGRLMRGGRVPPPPEILEVFAAPPWHLDRELRAFIARGRAVLAAEGGPAASDSGLAALSAGAGGSLLRSLEEVTARFQRDSERQMEELMTLQGVTVLLAVGLLVLSAVGVFRPMVERLKTDIAERSAAASRLKESEERLWRILEESPVGVSVSRRRDGKVVFANTRFTDIIGMSKEEFLGSTAREHYVDDAQRQVVLAILRRDGHLDDAEVEFRRKNGSPFWSLLTIRSADFEGEKVNLAWIYDITERKAAEQQILLASKVLENVTEAVLITDAENRIIFVNPAFTTITEYSKEEVLGRDPSFLRSGRHEPEFYTNLWRVLSESGHWEGEIWNRRKSGAFYAEWLSINALRDGGGGMTHFVAVFSDITHRKEDEERIWRQANYDALTGLPNRSLFLDRLNQAVRQSRREKKRFALLFLDLDGFKAVNDTLGHAAGDVLLQQTATRLSECVRATDTLARLAGDEFVVILDGVHGSDDPAKVAAKILAVLDKPYDLEAGTAQVHGSIGIALYPDDAGDGPALIRRADAAMYAVKRGGKNDFLFAGDLPPES